MLLDHAYSIFDKARVNKVIITIKIDYPLPTRPFIKCLAVICDPPEILCISIQPNFGVVPVPFQNLGNTRIRRGIIRHNDLKIGIGLRKRTLYGTSDVIFLIICRDHHRHEHLRKPHRLVSHADSSLRGSY